MDYINSWIELYLAGCTLEWSHDTHAWFPVTEEPYVGDGKYYREIIINEPPVILRKPK